jgi:hypothetical protein
MLVADPAMLYMSLAVVGALSSPVFMLEGKARPGREGGCEIVSDFETPCLAH